MEKSSKFVMHFVSKITLESHFDSKSTRLDWRIAANVDVYRSHLISKRSQMVWVRDRLIFRVGFEQSFVEFQASPVSGSLLVESCLAGWMDGVEAVETKGFSVDCLFNIWSANNCTCRYLHYSQEKYGKPKANQYRAKDLFARMDWSETQ